MIAGRGIVHSERTAPERRRSGGRLHGLQIWVALPTALEEVAPSFHHHPGATLPEREVAGVRLRVVAGAAYGMRSPVAATSPMFYVDASMAEGSELAVTDEYEERAVYVVEGTLVCGAERAEVGRMLVFSPGAKVVVRAGSATRAVLLGGAALAGERHIEWNFVSSSRERIERAKQDWRERRFATIPGDDVERIPLPE
jgi:redox-sensitive bicupin YhaK (pirin superfamily)